MFGKMRRGVDGSPYVVDVGGLVRCGRRGMPAVAQYGATEACWNNGECGGVILPGTVFVLQGSGIMTKIRAARQR